MATRLQQLINGAPATAWEKCWAERVTPWDLGGVTPVVKHMIEQNNLPQGKCLVPGCGTGYDVLALASPTRSVTGLDISQTALERAKELASTHANGKWTDFQAADFFSYTVDSPFDLIFDYTFFCALEPSMRPAWAQKMSQLLSQDGELVTLMFPVEEREGGPPYSVSPDSYKAVLQPCGFINLSLEENKFSIEARKGRELLGIWRKAISPKI